MLPLSPSDPVVSWPVWMGPLCAWIVLPFIASV